MRGTDVHGDRTTRQQTRERGKTATQHTRILTHECRKFWREMLPRIKFRNPAIPIQISRHTDPDGPGLLHIYRKSAASSSSTTTTPPTDGAAAGTPTPPAGTPHARNTQTPDTTPPAHTFKIRDLQPSEILQMLIDKTGAVVVDATPEETAQMAELADFRERSEADRVMVREKLLKERREAELLKLARGEVPTAA